jgi:oxygen-dependent protoporphyrinogen oxidase
MIDAAVIGGGVSGLTAGWHLQRLGLTVQVLEAEPTPGGMARSQRMGGYLMEHGPNSISAGKGGVEALSSALGLDDQICDLGPQVRRRYLLKDNSLHGIATGMTGFLRSSYLSYRARLWMMSEIFRRPRVAGNESVGAFFRRRFGPEFTERVIDPLVGGLFGGRADDISIEAAFPALKAMENRYGSLTVGVLASRWRGGAMPGRRLFSWTGGIGALPARLAQALGPALKCAVRVNAITQEAGGYRLDLGAAGSLAARMVIMALPPHAAKGLLGGFNDHAADAFAAMASPPLSVVFLGFERRRVAHPLDGLGYLVPPCEGRPVSGVLFSSSMYAGRAPDGAAAFTAYLGGAGRHELARKPAGELIALVRGELKDMLGARGAPQVSHVRQWRHGLPQMGAGHVARLQQLAAVEKARPGLFFTGNYFTGPGLAHCTMQAEKTARTAAAWLSGQTASTVVPAVGVPSVRLRSA